MEEGIFPGYKSISEQTELEEERRLCYVGITRAKSDLYLTCCKQRKLFGSTSYNAVSRFAKEIPEELLDGADEVFGSSSKGRKVIDFEDSQIPWKYGSLKKNSNLIKSYNMKENENKIGNSKIGINSGSKPFAFGRTAESFLNGLANKGKETVDLSKYEKGVKVYHKKFGEGIITEIEPEGEDLKVDISFEKFGHKRLMARFSNLEIIE